jgi:hypothetical protein
MAKAINRRKYCPKCELVKSVTDFNKHKARSDGLQDYCRECTRQATQKYMENRRKTDPGLAIKQKEYMKKWRDANREEINRKQRELQKTDEWKEYRKKWYKESDNYEYLKRWRAENPDKVKQYQQKTDKNRPEHHATKDANRRAQKRLPLEDRQISTAYRKAIKNDLCFYCGQLIEEMHDDHFFPLAKGGTDHWYNLRRSCWVCNAYKGSHCGTWFMLRESTEDRAKTTQSRIPKVKELLGENRLCKAGLHQMTPDNIAGRQCRKCRTTRQRERRAEARTKVSLT